MERIDADYEPRGKALKAQLYKVRSDPKNRAVLDKIDQDLAAERVRLSAYRAKQMQHA